MTGPTRKPRPGEGRGSQQSLDGDAPIVAEPKRKTTQLERVAMMLFEADEVCGSEFYNRYIPRFSVAIHKLRRAGYIITKRPCDQHYHEGTGWLYRLESLPFNPGKGDGGG